MEFQQLQEIVQAFFRELSRKRLFASCVFALALISMACTAIIWPAKYTTSAILYIDQQNAIEPLLGNQAAVQQVNPIQEAREKIYSRRILESVARQSGLIAGNSSAKDIAQVINMLNGGALGFNFGIQIANRGRNYITVSYTDQNAEHSFDVINALINAFILEVAETKRQSSRDAYKFIDNQVALYKKQLEEADQKLKQFNALNRDGTLASVDTKIRDLRNNIENLKLHEADLRARRNTIQKQLREEQQYLNTRSREDFYRETIQEYQSQLDTLLLSLTETHPDIVSLKLQIADLKSAISESSNTPTNTDEPASSVNPLFEQLRSSLAETELELNSAISRRKSIEATLESEYARSERLISRQAKLTELTRGYDVTKDFYEDMLNRKERARLTMTLDIEGEGTSYKIHEPPTFPLNPNGIQKIHLLALAPIMGILAPIGIILGFLLFDPRVRLPHQLKELDDVEVLAVIQPLRNIQDELAQSANNKYIVAIAIATLIAYVAICAAVTTGVI